MSACFSSPYLLDDWPSVFPLVQAVTGQRVDALHLARLQVSHLLVQEVLKSQLLILVLYVIHRLHLGEGKSHYRSVKATINPFFVIAN